MSGPHLPTLFTKTGCPWCAQARNVLDDAGLGYENVNVSNDATAFERMRELSGQGKAPVLDWHGDILSDFGAEELRPFLKSRGLTSA